MSGSVEEQRGDAISRILREANHETFSAAKDAIMQKVLMATLQEAVDELGSPEDIADRALALLGAEHTSLHGAVDALRERLLGEVVRHSTDVLADPEAAAAAARTRIPEDEPSLVEATEALKERLLRDVADRTTEALADAVAVSLQARAVLGDAPPVVVSAVDELRQRLIAEIARHSSEALSNPEATARQAIALMDQQHATILQAIDRLKEQILQNIVRESLARISDEVGGMSPPSGPLRPSDRAPQGPPAAETGSVAPRTAPADGSSGEIAPSAHLRRKAANGFPVDEPVAAPDASVDAVPAMGFYLYGIVENHADGFADAFPEGGIDPEYPPILLPLDAVAAIVSKVPLAPFRKKDAAWKETVAQAHERVLSQAAVAGCAVLPTYFGRTYESIGALKDALAEETDAIGAAMERLAGKREWHVKIYCDPERVQEAVGRSEEAVDAFKIEFADSVHLWSEEAPDAELARLEEGLHLAPGEVVETILSSCRERSYRLLTSCAVDVHRISLSVDSVFGNNRMVLNASYLVEEEAGGTFRDALARLVAEYEDLGLVYYVKGPHMPCRFALSDAPSL